MVIFNTRIFNRDVNGITYLELTGRKGITLFLLSNQSQASLFSPNPFVGL